MSLESPFTLDEARARGLTRARLLGKEWRRLGFKVYARRESADDPLIRLKAAMRRLPGDAVFSGPTAAWLHGLDHQAPHAIEATLPAPTRVAHLAGITIRRCLLEPADIAVRKGFRVTSPLRTVVDLCQRLDLVEAVVVLDAALHRKLIRLGDIKPRPRSRGVKRLRLAMQLAEPATESPMETRLRMALVVAGLPRPQVQVSLPNVFARADLFYPQARLVIEYDGATHRDSLASDDRRQNRLVEAGYKLLRFTAADVLGDARSVVATVRRALRA